MTDFTDELFATVRAATKARYPEARISETAMDDDQVQMLRDRQAALGAFTDDELAIIKLFRNAEIKVDHGGRLKIGFTLSDEACAAQLHRLLRS